MFLGLSADAFLAVVILAELAIVAGTAVVLWRTCSATYSGGHERGAAHARKEGAWYHTWPAQGVREAQDQDEQEVCRAHRQRRQDQDGAYENGEEGSAYTLAP